MLKTPTYSMAEIIANGKVTTSVLTTLNRELVGESIEGSGIFEQVLSTVQVLSEELDTSLVIW